MERNGMGWEKRRGDEKRRNTRQKVKSLSQGTHIVTSTLPFGLMLPSTGTQMGNTGVTAGAPTKEPLRTTEEPQ